MEAREKANDAIVELIQSKEFKQCIDKIEPDYIREDLASEVYLALLETRPEKIIGLYDRKELRFYAVRIIFNMACSNTSPFYKKYRASNNVYDESLDTKISEYATNHEGFKQDTGHKYYERINLEELFDDNRDMSIRRKKMEVLVLDLLEGQFDTEHWYYAGILKCYLEHGNYRAIAKATKIPFTSIFLATKEAIQRLRAMLDTKEIPTDDEVNAMVEKFVKLNKQIA